LWGTLFNDADRASYVKVEMEKLRFDLSARCAVLTEAEQTVLARLNAIETDPYELYYKDGTLIQADFSGVASFWRHSAKLQEDKALVIVYEPGKYEVSEEGVQPVNTEKEGPQGVPQPPHIDDSVEGIKLSLRHMGMRDDDPFLLAEIQRKQAARRAVYQEAVRRAEEKAREAALKQQEEERVAAEKARQEAERKAQWLRTRGKAGAETASPAAPQLPPRPPVSAAGGTAAPAPPARPTASSKVHRDRDYSGVAAPAPVAPPAPRPPAPNALAPPPPPSAGAAPARPKSPPRPAAPAAAPPKPTPASVSSKAHRDRDYAAPVGVAAPPTRGVPNPRPPVPEPKPSSAPTPSAASNRVPRDRDYSSSSASAQRPIAAQQSAGPSGVPKAASRDNSSALVRDTKHSSHAEPVKAPRDRDYAVAAAPKPTPATAANSSISAARVAAAAAVIDKDKTSAGNALTNAGALGVGRESGVPQKPAIASNRSAAQGAAAASASARPPAAPITGQKEQDDGASKTVHRSGSRDRARFTGEPAKSAAHSSVPAQASVGDKRHRSHSRDRSSNKAPALSGASSGASRRGDSRERRQHSRERGPPAQGYRGGDTSRGGYGRESGGPQYETDEFGRERVIGTGSGHSSHTGGDRGGTGGAYASSHQRHQQEKYYGTSGGPGGGGGGGGYRRN
jgi:hypothetical protein